MKGHPDDPPADFADRVDHALEELWRGGTAEFTRLLDDDSTAGPDLGDIFKVIGIQGRIGGELSPGMCIGHYEIIREIGRGGMGVVYEAEQREPKRRVALKVIRSQGPVDSLHVRLFHREVETLARLRHQGIAAIYDAGRTEDGRHFFAMELIPGANLLQYANARAPSVSSRILGTRERLDLFCKTCDAINYAHQRGVIHRDLKPSNIMVGDDSSSGVKDVTRGSGRFGGSSAAAGFSSLSAQVKVLDFGLARITDADVSQTTLLTETGRIVGTLSYMSPEQARGDADAIDVRSDVYSLGVILYELLTGQLPYEINRTVPHQALRAICEDAPRRPSTINRTLRGDLETIALKALEKDPDRRYPNAAAFAEDIRRQVTGQPILARPPSAVYQISRLVARHKVPAALLALLAAAVIAFAAITAVQADRIAEERDKALLAQQNEADARSGAETEAEKARRIQTFLQDMLASVDPGTAQGRDVGLLAELLADAARRVDAELGDKPAVAAAVRSTIGRTYTALGLYDEADAHLRLALAFYEAEFGDEALETAATLDDLGELLTRRGEFSDAEPLLRRALAIREHLLGEGHVDLALSYNRIGKLLGFTHDYEPAEELLRKAIEFRRRDLDPDDRLIVKAVGDLAWLFARAERLDEAAPLFREAADMSRRIFGPEHPDTAICINNLASLLKKRGEYAEAAELYGESIAIQRRVLGDDHPDLAESLVSWGDLLKRLGQYDDAEALFEEALDIHRTHTGEKNDFFAAATCHIASVRIAKGDYETAETLYRSALDTYLELHGERHLAVLICRNALGTLLARAERYAEAEPVLRQARELFRELHGEQHPGYAVFTSNLASVLTKLGRLEEAGSLLRGVVDFRREFYGETHPKVAMGLFNLAGVLLEQGELDEAERLYTEALSIQRGSADADHSAAGRMLAKLGQVHSARGDVTAAATAYEEAYAICAKALVETHADRVEVVTLFGGLLLEHGESVEAETARSVLREYLNAVRREDPVDAALVEKIESALDER